MECTSLVAEVVGELGGGQIRPRDRLSKFGELDQLLALEIFVKLWSEQANSETKIVADNSHGFRQI